MSKLTNILVALVPTALVAGLFIVMTAVAQQSNAQGAGVDQAAIARGAKAWADNCGRCHNLRAPSELSDHDWRVSVTHMRVRANIPGNVARDITAFLQASN